ncbi:hypothetical protein ACIO93_07740 [Streptomyces sp. NPDC087903]|uniref:hypothetical protein n=1 Tax=Streptomyces sp. NPDC087903 TaxID=3365819 RepID=UPI00382ACF8A
MTPRPRRLLGFAAVSVLFLTGCTADHDPAPGRAESPAVTRHGTAARTEQRLTAQVTSALDAVTDRGGSMVESGVERVSDGVHTRPDLVRDVPYELTVVCAGQGTVEIVLTPAATGAPKAVPCDRSVVSERLTTHTAPRVDVRARAGATGMVAWRIDKV